jgi:hypothetical protein
MSTTKTELKQWFQRGLQQGATHMIVVCDTYDWEDYPVYIEPHQNCREEAKQYDGANMQKIMEVYSMKLPMDQQLNEARAFHYE